MIQIAVCDDEVWELSHISTMLSDYISAYQNNFSYKTFENATELVNIIEKGESFDIILLDVIMPKLNGIEAAKEIRRYDANVKIIFLTSSAEFALESYAVGAYFYALKPIYRENFFSLLTNVFAEIQQRRIDSLIIKWKTGITRIPLEKLRYCEIISRTIFYYLSTGVVLEGTGRITELEEVLLAYPSFIKPHRSYIVNMNYIETLTAKEIIMEAQDKIPLPKAKYNEVKQAYLAFSFAGRNRLV